MLEYIGEERTGYLAAICSALALALTGICISYLCNVHHIDPLVLAFWRNTLLVTALFFILEISYPKLIEIDRSELFRILGFGIILAIFNYLWTVSVALNGAAVATFLVYSSVPFTSLLGWLIMDEAPPAGMFPAIICSICGCLLISGAWAATGRPLSLAGVETGLGSGCCFAIYSLAGRSFRKRGTNAWTAMLYSFACAALLLFVGELLVLSVTKEKLDLLPVFFSLGGAVSGWAVLIFLATGPTLLGFGLYTISLGYLPSGIVNLISTLEPPFAALFAYLLLGETLSEGQLLGAMLIVSAVFIMRLARYCLPSRLLLKTRLPRHIP